MNIIPAALEADGPSIVAVVDAGKPPFAVAQQVLVAAEIGLNEHYRLALAWVLWHGSSWDATVRRTCASWLNCYPAAAGVGLWWPRRSPSSQRRCGGSLAPTGDHLDPTILSLMPGFVHAFQASLRKVQNLT